MARRPVFVPSGKAPFADKHQLEFEWNGGFAVSQKQKNISALHEAYLECNPGGRILEISSKSMQELGVRLSAFNLQKYVPTLGRSVPLECVFQGGKVFSGGGPYADLYTSAPRDAKRDERLRTSGALECFCFEGRKMPLRPQTAFYNWLYINALMENTELADSIMEYDAFTDIEFNPQKSLNCQAEAAAVFVSLNRAGKLGECANHDTYLALLLGNQP